MTGTLPRSTSQIGAWIEQEFDVSYTRSAIIKLMHWLGMEFKKPKMVSQKMGVAKQQAFIEFYNRLLNSLSDDEAVMFIDAVHPTHTVSSADFGTARPRALVWGWDKSARARPNDVIVCGFCMRWRSIS